VGNILTRPRSSRPARKARPEFQWSKNARSTCEKRKDYNLERQRGGEKKKNVFNDRRSCPRRTGDDLIRPTNKGGTSKGKESRGTVGDHRQKEMFLKRSLARKFFFGKGVGGEIGEKRRKRDRGEIEKVIREESSTAGKGNVSSRYEKKGRITRRKEGAEKRGKREAKELPNAQLAKGRKIFEKKTTSLPCEKNHFGGPPKSKRRNKSPLAESSREGGGGLLKEKKRRAAMINH